MDLCPAGQRGDHHRPTSVANSNRRCGRAGRQAGAAARSGLADDVVFFYILVQSPPPPRVIDTTAAVELANLAVPTPDVADMADKSRTAPHALRAWLEQERRVGAGVTAASAEIVPSRKDNVDPGSAGWERRSGNSPAHLRAPPEASWKLRCVGRCKALFRAWPAAGFAGHQSSSS